MKKRSYLTVCLLLTACVSVFSLAGCQKKEKTADDNKTKTADDTTVVTNEEDKSREEEKEGSPENNEKSEVEEKDQETTGNPVDGGSAMIYYVDDASGEITGKNIDAKDEYDLWAGLQDAGILTEDCDLLSLSVNEEEKKIDLDFDSDTGDRIRSMGTAGETEITGCMINTYLEAYSCDGIRLTEEGNTFETAHGGAADGYSGIVSF